MKKIFLFSLIAMILFNGCSVLSEYASKPTVKFKTFRIENPGLFDADLVFVFEIDNPNPVGGKISSATYDLKIDGSNFVDGNLSKGAQLPANGKANFEIPVHINYLDFFTSASQFVKQDKVDYEISGELTVLAFKIPYKNSGEIDMPKLPEIKLKSVRTSGISLTGGDVIFELEMKNPAEKAIGLKGLDYDINLGGIDFGEGISRISKNVSGNGKTTLELPLQVDFTKLGTGALNLLRGQSSEYKISGDMEIAVPGAGSKKLPFEKSGSVGID
ncbi:MAG: LEA type 2 family protein [Candidatus Zixiibacteriota bacterium]